MSVFKQFDPDKSETLSPAVPHKITSYLRKVYHWAYLNPKHVKFLDNELIVSSILWGNHKRLRTSLLEEIAPNSHVLQPAAVYGKFSQHLAQHLGAEGSLDVIDIAPVQVAHTEEKLKPYTNASVRLADAAEPLKTNYDVIACYFLLHEIPDNYKLKVLNNLLTCLNDKGKLVIIDYHKPGGVHPLKPLLSLIFDTLEPYAKSLWWHDIQHFITHSDAFHFHKTTFFGGLYQKVVITK